MKTVITTGIKIIEKKNVEGNFFEVDSLDYNELRLYINELIFFNNKFYMVSEFNYETTELNSKINRVYQGKRIISET